MLAGHASGSWLSALGAGMPYNRGEKTKVKLIYFGIGTFLHYFPANRDSSLTKVPSLQTTGSSQPLDKTLALLGLTKGDFEGVGEFF